MSTTLNTKTKDAIVANISRLASEAAESLRGWENFSSFSFVTLASATKSQANRPALDRDAANAGTPQAAPAATEPGKPAVLDAIKRTLRVDPVVWKHQLERIAVLSLQESCENVKEGRATVGMTKFNDFAQEILSARTAGPTAQRTLDRIADIAAKHFDSASLLQMALECDTADKASLVKILLSAKIKPDFTPTIGAPTPLAIAASKGLSDVMQLLVDAGAKPRVPTSHLKIDDESTKKREFMNVWDARLLIEKLSVASKASIPGSRTKGP
jgi:hypothetical protein